MQRDEGLHLLSVNELSRCWPDVAKEEGGWRDKERRKNKKGNEHR